ncbi:MAG: UDP-glucose 4-epimerase GalE [Pseudomonadota bacterium]
MANVLVTGGAGYIGSHACKALRAAGHQPIAYDNLSTGWRDAVKFGPFEEGDLLDRARLDAVLAAHRPAAVMHFAALSNVGESTARPDLYWRNNAIGSMTLLDACVAAGIDKIVFSSTCATYGEAEDGLLSERSRQLPLNPYGASKLAVEHMLRDYSASFDLRSVSFRYFNVAGADQDHEIGEFHRPETHLIPLALDAASGRGSGFTINGDDYPTPDGTCIRDFVHVLDLIEAHLSGLDWLLQGGGSEVFNLGTGNGFSVRQVVSTVGEVTGAAVPMTIGARRPGDAVKLVSGGDRAMRMLGWRQDRSTLPAMIGDAWAWHQADGYRA